MFSLFFLTYTKAQVAHSILLILHTEWYLYRELIQPIVQKAKKLDETQLIQTTIAMFV